MVVYGIMPVYNGMRWLPIAIPHWLDHVDELIIVEGYQGPPHHNGGVRSRDGSQHYISEYARTHERVHAIRGRWNIHHDVGKAMTMRKALGYIRAHLPISEGDWIYICDVDEFYTPQQWSTITTHMKTAVCIGVHSRMFAYGPRWYINGQHIRGYHYTDSISFPLFGQMMHVEGRCPPVTWVLEDDPMFHYSWVCSPLEEYQRRRAEISTGRRDRRMYTWIREVFAQWTPSTSTTHYRRTEQLFGSYGWFPHTHQPLQQYTKSHPRPIRERIAQWGSI